MPASEPSQLTSTKSTRKMLYYKIFEKGPDAEWLVFIHGAGGSSVTWKYQIEAFRPYFNLLLLDLRDHGQSKNIAPAYPNYNFDIVCQDILQVIDHLGIKKAHFMSLSLGSVILQRLNYHRPELIDRMIMAGGVFKANIKIRLFVHSARFLNHFLPYRVMYNLFSFIVLPRKNHARARRIFRMQSQKLSPSEYLKWVELHKEFFHLLKNFLTGSWKRPVWSLWVTKTMFSLKPPSDLLITIKKPGSSSSKNVVMCAISIRQNCLTHRHFPFC
jgi:pimeloyl-ACP methyl ester carboxylesterase